jgi:hypothetical protein
MDRYILLYRKNNILSTIACQKKVGVMLPAYRKILVIKQERAQKRNSTEKADLVAGDGQGEFLRRICIHLNPCYPWGKGSEKNSQKRRR